MGLEKEGGDALRTSHPDAKQRCWYTESLMVCYDLIVKFTMMRQLEHNWGDRQYEYLPWEQGLSRNEITL